MLQYKFQNDLALYQFNNLSLVKEINHFISGREGGVSEDHTGTLNLSFNVGDKEENVMENRSRVAAAMNCEPPNLVIPGQTHGNKVGIVDRVKDFPDTDALITNKKGICIAVMSADCVPVLLYDRQNHAVAAVHAGWRGTVGKILSLTLEKMVSTYGTNPENVLAGIGPSICQDVYQVGEEVVERFLKAFGEHKQLIHIDPESGKGYPDLWEANKQQLLSLGVPEESIEVAGICTYSNPNMFFSARQSQNKAGRFAAGIILR
ncbi:MAG: peptidoglycan editing factor PgeF [Cytophagaceae bacterium]